MTLDALRPLADRLMAPLVSGAKRVGLTPNGISVLALVASLAAAGSFIATRENQLFYLAGAVFVFLNGVLDLVDGNLARELGTDSRAGDLLDHVFDRYADLIIIGGLAVGLGAYALGLAAITGVLMTSYLGTQAQAVDLDRVYGGVLGRADRLALTGVATAVAAVVNLSLGGFTLVGWLLIVFAVVGHITALQRFYYAMKALAE